MKAVTIKLRLPQLRTVREVVFTVGGLGMLTAAAATGLGLWAGLAAGGVSMLLLEYLSRPEPTPGSAR